MNSVLHHHTILLLASRRDVTQALPTSPVIEGPDKRGPDNRGTTVLQVWRSRWEKWLTCSLLASERFARRSAVRLHCM